VTKYRVFNIIMLMRNISFLVIFFILLLTVAVAVTGFDYIISVIRPEDFIRYGKVVRSLSVGVSIFAVISFLYTMFFSWYQRGNYDEDNEFYKTWYEKTKNLVGEDWFIRVFKELKFDKTDLNIISVSAYRAEYENVLYKYLVKGNKNVKFDCCDISPKKFNSSNDGKSSFIYNSKSIDAIDLKEHYKDKYDIVFDIKGALWYSVFKNRFMDYLKVYKEILSEDGVIIIDSSRQKYSSVLINNIVFSYFKKLIGIVESSTTNKLKSLKMLRPDRYNEIKKYIDSHFYSIDIKMKNNNTDTSVMILKPKE
jgi:hypothetical protein